VPNAENDSLSCSKDTEISYTFAVQLRHKKRKHRMSVADLFISKQLSLPLKSVENTVKLMEGGATIPFISRYRKEATGGLNEVQIENIKAWNDKYHELEKRKEYVIKSISAQEKLTPELTKQIQECWDSVLLEDLYLPFKPKRQTRAEIARKKDWKAWPNG